MALKSSFIAVGCAALMTACAHHAPDGAPTSSQLQAHHWTLQQAAGPDGQPLGAIDISALPPVTLHFGPDALSLQAGCNNQFGPYQLRGHTLQIKNLAATMMACPPQLMQRDQALAHQIQGDSTVRLGAQQSVGATLVLTTDQGNTLTFVSQTSQ